MLLTLKIENFYEDGDKSATTLYDVEVPDPPTEPEPHEEWAEEHLYPLTGTGRYAGNDAGEERTPDAAYFVEIIAASHPALVGRTYEWGV